MLLLISILILMLTLTSIRLNNIVLYIYCPVQIAGDAEHVEWANQGGDILDQYSQAHYINNNRFDSADSSETCFPAPNWARLQQLKAMYDPHGLFRPLDYFRTDNGFSGIAGDSDYY